MTNRNRNQGFTLIELVLVITIIGILAAFAIPRFAGIETQARVSVMQGVAGSLESAAALAHAKQLAEGLSAGGSIVMENQTIAMTNGYPTNADIQNAIRTNGNITADGSGTFTYTGFTSCSVTYTAPTVSGSAPAINTTNLDTASNCQ